jgi:hypothetical protein
MGNLDVLTTDGGLNLTGDYRAGGRPNNRTITLGSKTLERDSAGAAQQETSK